MSVQAITDPRAGVPIGLVDIHRELLDAIPSGERRFAERITVATRHRLPAGAWDPNALIAGRRRPHGAVLLNGTIVRDVVLAGRASGHLFGPGDVLRPWVQDENSLTSSWRWQCGQDGAEIAVLDERFERVASKWPGIAAVIGRRLAEQLDAAALRTAIVSLPRAEQRVLALLWQLADQWGTVTPAGVVVRVRLTHELIGRLVGARRPTITLAIQALTDEGILSRTEAREWRLAHDSHSVLDTLFERPRPATPTLVH